MRTPGRCTNVEGCWISASERDVWLTVGEDFACPNCGELLTSPPRRAISFSGLKVAALRGAAVATGLAAVAFVALKVGSTSWIEQPRIAGAAKPAGRMALTGITGQQAYPGEQPRQPAAPGPVDSQPAQPVWTEATAQKGDHPPSDDSMSRSIARPVRGEETPTASPRLGRQAPDSVLLYAASNDRSAPPPAAAVPPPEPEPEPSARTQQADFEAATFITMVSQAMVVPPPSSLRPIVLPISFGRPVAPEGDTPPVNLRWRYRGIVSLRRSTFLPSPAPDALAELCETPSLLR